MEMRLARFLTKCVVLASGWWVLPVFSPDFVRGQDQAYKPLQGRWQAVELVDDGRVIPQEAIPTWIPSGGQLEVIDNTIVFTSNADGQRHARTFEVDATRYPSEINLRAEGQVYAHGIYKLDEDRLVICAAPAKESGRPTDFSASQGSRRVLLVLKRATDAKQPGGEQPAAGTKQPALSATGATQTSPSAPIDLAKLPSPPDLRSSPGSTGKLLTDAEVVRMLLGTWKYKDAYGEFFLTLDSKGTFTTFRETPKTSAFQQVFVRAPISSGTWVLNNGQLTFRCTASVQRERVNQQAPYAVRSVSASDLIFMDARGQVVKGVKVR